MADQLIKDNATGVVRRFKDQGDGTQAEVVISQTGVIALAGGAPTNSAPGDVAAAGTGTAASKSDHKHGREAAGLQRVVVDLTAAQIKTLFSAPVQLVAAPGAGKMLRPVRAQAEYHFGTAPFGPRAGSSPSEQGRLDLAYATGAVIDTAPTNDIFSLGNSDADFPATIQSNTLYIGFFQAGDIANSPIRLTCGVDPAGYGIIATSSVQAAGLGYAPGDTFQINPGNGSNYRATGTVDTVGAGGAVLTYHLTDNDGPDFQASENDSTTVLTGAGDGNLVIHVATITPGDGHMRMTLDYEIITLST